MSLENNWTYYIHDKNGSEIWVRLGRDNLDNDGNFTGDAEKDIAKYGIWSLFELEKAIKNDPSLPQDIHHQSYKNHSTNFKIIIQQNNGYLDIPLHDLFKNYYNIYTDIKTKKQMVNSIEEMTIVDNNLYAGSEIVVFDFRSNKLVNVKEITLTSNNIPPEGFLRMKISLPGDDNQTYSTCLTDLSMSLVAKNDRKFTGLHPVEYTCVVKND